MNGSLKAVIALILIASAFVCQAKPQFLKVTNNTPDESNAYIRGKPSNFPTPALSTSTVLWYQVEIACLTRPRSRVCPALVKMKTNTPNPVNVGSVTLDLVTGIISPSVIVGNGYRITAIGPGHAVIDKQ